MPSLPSFYRIGRGLDWSLEVSKAMTRPIHLIGTTVVQLGSSLRSVRRSGVRREASDNPPDPKDVVLWLQVEGATVEWQDIKVPLYVIVNGQKFDNISRSSVDTSNPAISRQRKTGHCGRRPRLVSSTSRRPPSASRCGASCASFAART